MASELQAGPTVQIILARRGLQAGCNGSAGESARFGEGFPFFKLVPFKISVLVHLLYMEIKPKAAPRDDASAHKVMDDPNQRDSTTILESA